MDGRTTHIWPIIWTNCSPSTYPTAMLLHSSEMQNHCSPPIIIHYYVPVKRPNRFRISPASQPFPTIIIMGISVAADLLLSATASPPLPINPHLKQSINNATHNAQQGRIFVSKLYRQTIGSRHPHQLRARDPSTPPSRRNTLKQCDQKCTLRVTGQTNPFRLPPFF